MSHLLRMFVQTMRGASLLLAAAAVVEPAASPRATLAPQAPASPVITPSDRSDRPISIITCCIPFVVVCDEVVEEAPEEPVVCEGLWPIEVEPPVMPEYIEIQPEPLDPVEVECLPSFVGGEQALLRYISERFQWPVDAGCVSGIAVVSFIVRTDGSLDSIRVLRDPGAGCGAAAARMVAEMPRWIPASIGGRPVDCRFVLPVRLCLDGFTSGDPDRIYEMFDLSKIATFPGGEAGLYKHMRRYIPLPDCPGRLAASDTAIVSLVFNKDGSWQDLRFLKSAGRFWDERIGDAIEDMPHWIPAEANGHPVRMRFIMPVRIYKCVDTTAAAVARAAPQQPERGDSGRLRIWPNPSSGPVNIAWEGAPGPCSMVMYDQIGRVVWARETQISAGPWQESVDLSRLSDGVYTLATIQAGHRTASPLLIQKQ